MGTVTDEHWPPLGAEDSLPLLPFRAPEAAPPLSFSGLGLQPPGSWRVMVAVGVAASLGGWVAVGAGHRAAAGVRIQGADWAADVGAIREQGAARGEGVAGGWGEAARDSSQAGAGARRGEQVARRLGSRAV